MDRMEKQTPKETIDDIPDESIEKNFLRNHRELVASAQPTYARIATRSAQKFLFERTLPLVSCPIPFRFVSFRFVSFRFVPRKNDHRSFSHCTEPFETIRLHCGVSSFSIRTSSRFLANVQKALRPFANFLLTARPSVPLFFPAVARS